MLKSLALAASLAVVPVVLSAQETMPMAIMADCADTRTIKQFIYRELAEVPFSGGWGVFQRHDLEFAEGLWKIYTSPDWGTFTIAVEFPDDAIMCLVALGDNLEPFQDRSFR